MSLPRLPFDKALRDMVAVAVGKPVGLYGLPTVDAQPGRRLPADPPYLVLYALPSVYSGPAYGDDHADAEWSYQFTAVGERADQAVWLRDRLHAAILGRSASDPQVYATPLVVDGMRVTLRRADDEDMPTAENGVVSYALRYTFHVTPA